MAALGSVTVTHDGLGGPAHPLIVADATVFAPVQIPVQNLAGFCKLRCKRVRQAPLHVLVEIFAISKGVDLVDIAGAPDRARPFGSGPSGSAFALAATQSDLVAHKFLL